MPGKLDSALRKVRRQLRRGVPFEHIEADIEYSKLDAEEKAVLWLYAWCGGQATELKNIVTTEEHCDPTQDRA